MNFMLNILCCIGFCFLAIKLGFLMWPMADAWFGVGISYLDVITVCGLCIVAALGCAKDVIRELGL